MEIELFKKKSQRWLNDRVIVVRTNQTVSKILQMLGTHFAHYIVVRDTAGRISGVLSTIDFLSWFESMKKSRFPGDQDPGDLRLRQNLTVMSAAHFQHVDVRSLRDPIAAWLKDCDPCTVVAMVGAEILGIIPKEHFYDWLEELNGPAAPPKAPTPPRSSLRN